MKKLDSDFLSDTSKVYYTMYENEDGIINCYSYSYHSCNKWDVTSYWEGIGLFTVDELMEIVRDCGDVSISEDYFRRLCVLEELTN